MSREPLMNRKLLMFGGGGLAVALLAAFAAWFFFFRSDAPDEVSLEGALETLRTPTAAGQAGAGSTPAAGATGQAGSGSSAAGGIDGAWGIASAGETFVGYRVQEELAQIGAVTAVGRTSDVRGTVTIRDSTVQPGSSFTANLQTLRSDRSQRDNALRRQALETDLFPNATFTLKEAVRLPAGFANGEAFSTTLKGALELHGVTRDVEIPAQAKVENGLIVVVGSIEIRFADYNIAQPRAAIVLSVEDKGVMEFQLFLQKQ